MIRHLKPVPLQLANQRTKIERAPHADWTLPKLPPVDAAAQQARLRRSAATIEFMSRPARGLPAEVTETKRAA